MRTPWGESQDIDTIADGITFASTASHGGILLSEERYAQMPEKYRKTFAGGRWYEEDCDWAKVAVTFPDCFELSDVENAKQILKSYN